MKTLSHLHHPSKPCCSAQGRSQDFSLPTCKQELSKEHLPASVKPTTLAPLEWRSRSGFLFPEGAGVQGTFVYIIISNSLGKLLLPWQEKQMSLHGTGCKFSAPCHPFLCPFDLQSVNFQLGSYGVTWVFPPREGNLKAAVTQMSHI